MAAKIARSKERHAGRSIAGCESTVPTLSVWLLLIHQIPPDPPYLRVKVGRRLKKIGALQLKSTVYVLPADESSRSKLEWLAREIRAQGGEAILTETRFIGGISDDEVRGLFRAEREAQYVRLQEDIEHLLKKGPHAGATAQLGRLRRRFEGIQSLDFFDASGGRIAQRRLDEADVVLNPPEQGRLAAEVPKTGDLRGRIWATRRDVHVDRMASSWLIRRFIDPEARFRFVGPEEHTPRPSEIRFDMYDAEFTHDADLCTFEVLARLAAPRDRALREIAEIVHDVDLRDGKFERAEAAGIARVIEGIRAAHPRDEDRIARAEGLFEGLYRSFGGSS